MALIDAGPYFRQVIGCAIEAHKTLGPGLVEAVYETCLCDELTRCGLAFAQQRKMRIVYKNRTLDLELRPDLIVEIKSVQAVLPIHEAQLHTYLKLTGIHTGLLLNFNQVRLTDGIRRRLL